MTDARALDVIDIESYGAGPAPLASAAEMITLRPGQVEHPAGVPSVSLDGSWELVEGGTEDERLHGSWSDGIPVQVPGSVHSALVAAGRLPDTTIGKNQLLAREESFKTWWYRRTFTRPELTERARLIFDGVCNRCSVWLNGHKLGDHEGMFGGPEFDISGLLADENTLVVRLEPIPFEGREAGEWETNPLNNLSWRRTVVFNNVYGWHYSNLPSLGIWQSVTLTGAAEVALPHPFVATTDARGGTVDLAIRLEGQQPGWSGTLRATIGPETFDGPPYAFEYEIHSDEQSLDQHLRFAVPEPRLWWPVDLGRPELYRLSLSFTPVGGGQPDYKEIVFGIRTIEMAPLPGGPTPDKYNWTFVINGEPHFVKGTGWSTMDALMDFSRERYDRFLTLAQQHHVQMLRAWGSGMPETDDFFELCDQKGIMVLQEWPTAWDSHNDQPYDILEETVRRNTLRLRNHPSLAMWGAGNESPHPFGAAIDMMGRLSIELDGTRPYHRGEPWGGSIHDYTVYWRRAHPDHNVNVTADFFGEFGLACMPAYESILRYLPAEERTLWPPPADGTIAYHTPIFNTREDLSRLTQYARYFVPEDCTMEQFIVGSQLSQVVGVRHTLERARTRWPDCTGVLYYKMNDNFPAASWSCVDWYGAPKIGYYFFQDAFEPLHACILFSTLNFAGTPVDLPVYLLDDAGALLGASWNVMVRAYDSQLHEIKRQEFSGADSITSPHHLGNFSLTFEQTDTTPLLTVVEVRRDEELVDRTFYWTNYEAVKGSLFTLPRTRLELSVDNGQATVHNAGDLPAVAVEVARPGHLDTFMVSDNFFWLDPGESKTVSVNDVGGLTVKAWNVE